MGHSVTVLQVSDRQACRAIHRIRSSQRYVGRPHPVQDRLHAQVIAIAKESGRYSYRTVTGLLRSEDWEVGKDRVYTIWQQEGDLPQSLVAP